MESQLNNEDFTESKLKNSDLANKYPNLYNDMLKSTEGSIIAHSSYHVSEDELNYDNATEEFDQKKHWKKFEKEQKRHKKHHNEPMPDESDFTTFIEEDKSYSPIFSYEKQAPHFYHKYHSKKFKKCFIGSAVLTFVGLFINLLIIYKFRRAIIKLEQLKGINIEPRVPRVAPVQPNFTYIP